MTGISLDRAQWVRFTIFSIAGSFLEFSTNMSYCMSITSNATRFIRIPLSTPEVQSRGIRMPDPGLNFYNVLEERFAGKSGFTIKQSPAVRANEQTQNGSGLANV